MLQPNQLVFPASGVVQDLASQQDDDASEKPLGETRQRRLLMLLRLRNFLAQVLGCPWKLVTTRGTQNLHFWAL